LDAILIGNWLINVMSTARFHERAVKSSNRQKFYITETTSL